MAAVLDRYGTGPRSFGATFRILRVKTERTAKKRRKNEQKWARYGLTKRVRAADLFLMDRYALRADGQLAELAEQVVHAGAGPRHLAATLGVGGLLLLYYRARLRALRLMRQETTRRLPYLDGALRRVIRLDSDRLQVSR